MQGPPGQPPYGYPPQQPQYGQQQYGQQPAGGYGQPPPQQWGPPPGMQPQGGGRRAPTTSVTTGLYVAMYVLCMLGTGFLGILGGNRATQEAIPFIPLPIFVWSIMSLVLIYKMWESINDGMTKPTPGAAVGFLFIPFFSIYWIFIAWATWPNRYNDYCHRHGIQAPRLTIAVHLCSILLWWVPIAGIVLMAMAIAKSCKAINALR